MSVSTLTADSTLITADTTDQVNSIAITDIKKVPSSIPENRPKPINNEPCTVTAATLGDVAQQTNTATSVFFSQSITALGKICDVSTIQSYGWVYSDSSTDIKTIDDIDTLKATSGIEVREFFPTQKTDGCSPKLISNLDLIKTHTTQITGLTNPATKYWRFFVRTNISDDYEKADSISTVYASSTFVGVVYSETSNVRHYSYGFTPVSVATAQDNEYRTIRIMDKDQNLVDFTGLRGLPLDLYSKIVPYVVTGLPLPSGIGVRNTGFAQEYHGLYGNIAFAFYHATDRQIAINAAKANSIGNTGASKDFVFGVVQGKPFVTDLNNISGDPVKTPLQFEGVTIYRNMFSGEISTYGAVEAMPNGFYAYKIHNYAIDPGYEYINSTIPEDSYAKNYETKFPNASGRFCLLYTSPSPRD